MQLATQCHTLGGDQAAPNTVLTDIPAPQRQRQALDAYHADGDGRGRLLASLVGLHTDREPVVGIEVAVSAPGVPDDLLGQRLIGEPTGRRSMRRTSSGPVQEV